MGERKTRRRGVVKGVMSPERRGESFHHLLVSSFQCHCSQGGLSHMISVLLPLLTVHTQADRHSAAPPHTLLTHSARVIEEQDSDS